MKKVVVSLVGAAALATITAGMAAAPKSTVASNDFFDNSAAGVYVAGNLGYGRVNTGNSNLTFNTVALNKKDAHGFAWNVNLGYQFNQYLALEAGYISYFDHKAKNTTAFSGKDVSLSGIDLVAKGILPINDQLNAFAKVGVMRLVSEDSSTTAGVATVREGHRYVPVFGIGAGYNIDKQTSFNVQALYTTGAKADKDAPAMAQSTAILAGISYKLGNVA